MSQLSLRIKKDNKDFVFSFPKSSLYLAVIVFLLIVFPYPSAREVSAVGGTINVGADLVFSGANGVKSSRYSDQSNANYYTEPAGTSYLNNMYVAGSLGIGKTNPATSLEVSAVADPVIRISEGGSTNSYSQISDTSSSQLLMKKVSNSGTSDVIIDSNPTDGVSAAVIRMFRTTVTNGRAALDIDLPDNTGTINSSIAGRGDSYLNVNNGELGIGTSTPDYSVEISNATPPKLAITDVGLAHGVTTWAQTDSYFLIDETTANDGGAQVWGFSTGAGTTPVNLLGVFGSTDPSDAAPAIRLAAGKRTGTTTANLGSSETVFQLASTPGTATYMTVLGSGNVGIGITNPANLLAVNQSSNTTPATVGTYGLAVLNQGSTIFTVGSDATYTYLQSWNSRTLDFNNQGNNVIFSGSGNVGIGITNPAAKLVVSGTASVIGAWNGNTVNGMHFGFDSNTGRIMSLQNGTAWRQLNIDGSTVAINTGGGSYLGVGTTTPSPHKMWVKGGGAAAYALVVENGTDATNANGIAIRAGQFTAGTGNLIDFYDGDGGAVGNITFSGATVSYAAFTANHETYIPAEFNESGYPYGTLLCIDSAHGGDSEANLRSIVYYSRACDGGPYSNKILGVYAGKVQRDPKLHQVYVLGDGQILVSGEGGDIKVGDQITTSSAKGIGMKANDSGTTFGVSQENYHFSSPSEVKLIAVQYGLGKHVSDNLTSTVKDQENKINELQKQIEELKKVVRELK